MIKLNFYKKKIIFLNVFWILKCINFIHITNATNSIKFDSYQLNKTTLRDKAKEMFMHGYKGYMKYAFPHDELMPISCKGRERGVTPSRGDVDDSLGNFSLTLVDSMDTLIVIGEYREFEKAVKLVIEKVKFDSDLIVSVFETNIRMIGGLISAHLMSVLLKNKKKDFLQWYSDELLYMAKDLADRLLPAFNTTSGVPHSRINLKYGLYKELKDQHDTCTACGGTMILEWAALSRLTGNYIYEEKARRAMDFLWNQRNRGSDLMGTVLNINSGDWIRRDSGIGAGIDSYYEYTLKAYILLGEEDYLYRFNKHYDAVMRYLNKGLLFIDVHMHKPTVATRFFMDALLAFWPGVQVLKGDLKSAIEMHEMLYNVVKKHKFLPDAFTHDLQVHWAQHPLRPEFIESTYFLYRATKDPYYLNVAKEIMNSLELNVRTSCGFAAVKDVRTLEKVDEMESFVLAETFKYLYLIFAEPNDLIFDIDNYVLTTEAHFIPLIIGETASASKNILPRRIMIDPDEIIEDNFLEKKRFKSACLNVKKNFQNTKELLSYSTLIRKNVKKLLNGADSSLFDNTKTCKKATERLKAWSFSVTNVEHLKQLKKMGVEVKIHSDGRLQLSHSTQNALNEIAAKQGTLFLKEIVEIIQQQENKLVKMNRIVQIVSEPHFGKIQFIASPAQFGMNLTNRAIEGEVLKAYPYKGCFKLKNFASLKGRIALIQRGDCMFQEKATFAQQAGAIAAIIIDNQYGTTIEKMPLFAMSADTKILNTIKIPVVFLFNVEGKKLINEFNSNPRLLVRVSDQFANPAILFENWLLNLQNSQQKNYLIELNLKKNTIQFNFWFEDAFNLNDLLQQKTIIEKNIKAIEQTIVFNNKNLKQKFLKKTRLIANSLIDHSYKLKDFDYEELRLLIHQIKIYSFNVFLRGNEVKIKTKNEVITYTVHLYQYFVN